MRPVRLVAVGLLAAVAGCASPATAPLSGAAAMMDVRPRLVLAQHDEAPSILSRILRLVHLEQEPVEPEDLLDPEQILLRSAQREGADRWATKHERTAESGAYLGSEDVEIESGVQTAGIPLPVTGSGALMVEFGALVPVERSFAVPYVPRDYQLMLGLRLRF